LRGYKKDESTVVVHMDRQVEVKIEFVPTLYLVGAKEQHNFALIPFGKFCVSRLPYYTVYVFYSQMAY